MRAPKPWVGRAGGWVLTTLVAVCDRHYWVSTVPLDHRDVLPIPVGTAFRVPGQRTAHPIHDCVVPGSFIPRLLLNPRLLHGCVSGVQNRMSAAAGRAVWSMCAVQSMRGHGGLRPKPVARRIRSRGAVQKIGAHAGAGDDDEVEPVGMDFSLLQVRAWWYSVTWSCARPCEAWGWRPAEGLKSNTRLGGSCGRLESSRCLYMLAWRSAERPQCPLGRLGFLD